MSIHLTMTKKDGNKEQADFRDWITCAAWLERRHGQYTEIEAHEMSADKIKQGMNSERR